MIMRRVKRLERDTIIDETDAPGTPVQRKGKTPREEATDVAPKTSSTPKEDADTSKSPVANRNAEGPRQAGPTPRPTDKPIVGGDRG
jgi:hypothetical protein